MRQKLPRQRFWKTKPRGAGAVSGQSRPGSRADCEFLTSSMNVRDIVHLYSGIAQRDAALSQNAAIASAQDSAVMRVIAAITIFFLPATTTAVRT